MIAITRLPRKCRLPVQFVRSIAVVPFVFALMCDRGFLVKHIFYRMDTIVEVTVVMQEKAKRGLVAQYFRTPNWRSGQPKRCRNVRRGGDCDIGTWSYNPSDSLLSRERKHTLPIGRVDHIALIRQ